MTQVAAYVEDGVTSQPRKATATDTIAADGGDDLNFGRDTRATMRVAYSTTTSRGSLELMPDDMTISVAPVASRTGFIQWNSTLTVSFAAGSLGTILGVGGTMINTTSTFAFNEALVFNFGPTIVNDSGTAITRGASFTLVDQPLFEADTQVITKGLHNSVRAQPRFTTSSGGTFTVTNCTLYETAGTVGAGATATTWRCFRAGNLAVSTGTITTKVGLEIDVFNDATTNFGIRCNMVNAGANRFINMTGSTISEFAADIHVTDGTAFVLGTPAGNRVELLRPSAGVARMINVGGTNNEGLDFDLDTAVANNIEISSSTSAGLQINVSEISVGTSATGGTNNWQFLESFGAKTISVGGDFARHLFSASANVTLDAAMSNSFTYTINDPALVLGTGSTVNAGNMLIQTAPSVGTNRYGLLITSNPSGGTLNYAFRQSNASANARFDGRLDINRGIALGGGAAPTFGTIGGAGPTAAAQAQWVEIDIGTVAHWIPVWV